MTSSLYRIGDRIIHETHRDNIEYHKIYYIINFSGKDAIILSQTPDGKPSHVVYRNVVGKGTFFKHLPKERKYFDEELFELW